jgi:hypothetical protein
MDSLANSLRIVKRHLTDNAFFPATSGADIISLGPATRHGRMVDRTMRVMRNPQLLQVAVSQGSLSRKLATRRVK